MKATNNLLHPHGVLGGIDVILDYIDDNQRRLKRFMEKLDENALHWKADEESNSIAVNIWHMGRIFDIFLTKLSLGFPPDEESWFRLGWAEKTGYDPRGLGLDGWGSVNQYTLEDVANMPKFSKDQLLDYIDDSYQTVCTYLQSTSMTELAQPGIGMDGKFTRYQLISMALMDNVRHLGEIRLIKSLWDRAKNDANATF